MDESLLWRRGLAALRRAVRIVGGQCRAAEAVGVGQSAVSACLRNGRRVPAEWCIPLERLTEACGECVPRHELRPDLWQCGHPPAPAQSGVPRSGAVKHVERA